MAGLRKRIARLLRVLRTGSDQKAEVLKWQAVRKGPTSGLEFLLPAGAPGSWSERILEGVYEPQVVELFARRAVNGGSLLDVGAHIGYYTAVWLKVGGARSDALEPLPQNREVIAQVSTRNNFEQRVCVHPYAASDKSGPAELVLPGDSLGKRSMARLRHTIVDGGMNEPSVNGRLPHLQVETRRVDDLMEAGVLQPPSLVKIDVEGAEAFVIRGADKTLALHKPWIICEVHGIEQALAVAELLHNLGYSLTTLGETKASMGLFLAVFKN